MEVDEAFSLICRAIDSGRVANGYVVSGDLGRCEELAERVLAKLFPDDSERIATRVHPDVAYLAPESLLPTIVSRSQRIDLERSEGILEGEAYEGVRAVMESSPQGVWDRTRAGETLAEILGAAKDEAEDENAALVRKAFFKTVMSFVRGWMAEGRLPRHKAFADIEAVEEAYRRSGKSMGDAAVLVGMVERMAFP